MTEKRLARRRAPAIGSGSASALKRRTGRGPAVSDGPVVAQYFGNDDDTPVIELLKAVRPMAQDFRGGEFIHVSDVISKCVRRIALMRQMGARPPQETIMDGQAITFAIGEALHDFVKAKFIKGHPQKVWADWKCDCGHLVHRGTFSSIPKRTFCPECGGPSHRHHEVPFVYTVYKLKGTPDLLLWLEQYNAFYIIEIKSISADGWKEIVRPLPDHMVQIAFYWRILRDAGINVVNRVSILYVNKEFSFKFPYKEFMIDPSAVDLTPYIEDLDALKAAEDGGPLPARVLCSSDRAPEAKKCHMCAACFARD